MKTQVESGGGNIYYTTYTGTGYDTGTRTLTFPRKPLAVFISGNNVFGRGIWGSSSFICKSAGEAGVHATAEWSGNSLTWIWSNQGMYATYACNTKDWTYYVVALLE